MRLLDDVRTIPPARLWLLASSIFFLGFFIIGLVAIAILNGSPPNHMLFPVGAYTGLFQIMWSEHPLGALQFILTKSAFTFAHQDPRSGLNIWTLEYDSITLLIYLATALIAGRLLSNAIHAYHSSTGLYRSLLGATSLVIAVTYMSNIEHCSGPTWVGFVALYGMGFDGFEIYPYYQWIFGLVGLGLLGWGLFKLRRN
jgi:hypothetical protein